MTATETVTAPAGLSPWRRRWLLVVAGVDVLLVVASMVALNAALPDIAKETSATQTQLTWIVDGYTLALACLLLPAGALGDRYGRRGALLVGLAVFTLASAAPIVWRDPGQLIAARAVAGVGAALVMPATLSLLTSAFPRGERAKAVGIWAGAVGSSAIVGFLGAGTLLHYFSWGAIFYGFAGAGLVMIVVTFTVGSSRDDRATPIDWTGAALIGAAIAVFVLGVVEAPTRGWTDVVVLGCLAAGTGLAALFAGTQLRARHPLLDVRLFARPDFGAGAAAITLLFLAMFGFFFVVMQFIQLVMGYSALQTAFALAPLAVPMMIVSTTIHLVLPRIGLRAAMTVGLLMLAAGLLWMARLQADAIYVDLIGPLIVSSVGLGLVATPATGAIMAAVPDDKQGVASAVNDATREIGAAVGIAAAGSVLAAAYHGALAPDLGAFPAPVRDAAADSLAAALTAAQQMGPAGERLGLLARAAFVDASGLAMTALAATVLAGALLMAAWAPGRDGRQWAILRRGPKLTDRAAASDQPEHHRVDDVGDRGDGGVGGTSGDDGRGAQPGAGAGRHRE